MTWLITGGAGYIGAHVVRDLLDAGEQAIVLDDLSTGSRDVVPAEAGFVQGSVLDAALLERVFREHRIAGVIHIAGKKRVEESVARPLYYYRENVDGLRTLLDAMVAAGVRRLVFSSSAAVYGMPDVDLVHEDTPCAPINPYGESKLVGEWLIRAAAQAHGIAYASLRYFNVAGAARPELADRGAFNLIPMVFDRIGEGLPPRIFGTDYATPDGTCVRDFIHVQDLAAAHIAAARRLVADPEARLTLNVGRGEGTSVRAMVDLIAEVTGSAGLGVETAARRPGDPARVVAASARIERELGFDARFDVRAMVESAWAGRLARVGAVGR